MSTLNLFNNLEELNYWWKNQIVIRGFYNWSPYTFTDEDFKYKNEIIDILYYERNIQSYYKNNKDDKNIIIYLSLALLNQTKWSLSDIILDFKNKIIDQSFDNIELKYLYIKIRQLSNFAYIDDSNFAYIDDLELLIFTSLNYASFLLFLYYIENNTSTDQCYDTYLYKAVNENCSQAILWKINNIQDENIIKQYKSQYIKVLTNEERYYELGRFYYDNNDNKQALYYYKKSYERYNDFFSLKTLYDFYYKSNINYSIKYLEIICEKYNDNYYLKELVDFYYNNLYFNKIITIYEKLINNKCYEYYYKMAILYDTEFDNKQNYLKYIKKAIEYNIPNSKEHFINYIELNDINDMSITMFICNKF